MSKNPRDCVQLDQLLTKEGFLRLCRLDHTSQSKLEVDNDFLTAAEKDGFIKPITIARGTNRNEKGENVETDVSYYSPFQIYILACLAKNKVVNGELRSDENLEYQKDQKIKLLHWGWGGLTLNVSLANTGAKYHPDELNIYQFCDDFRKFLVLLHTFGASKNEFRDRQKMRMFNDSPAISYDFSPAKDGGEKIIKPFGLDFFKLEILKKNIGRLAQEIDPLELWYPYIRKHPRFKKDLLKGDAQLAQEIYIIYDLLVELLETITGKKEPGLLDTLYEGRPLPMLMSKAEYAHGTDSKVMWSAIEKFKNWTKQKDNKKYIPDGNLEKLKNFEKELEAFESKYGDKSYVSGFSRPVEYEEKLGIKDLDPEVLGYVEQMIKQDGGQTYIKDQDEIKQLIAESINFRLDNLRRKLWAIFNEVYQKLQKEVSQSWDTLNNFGNYFWFHQRSELEKLPREKQLEKYRTEEQLLRSKTIKLSQKRDSFSDVTNELELIFCQKCRKRPVETHNESGDQIAYDAFICDECVKNPEELGKTKLGEWRCFACGEVLYKFNYENRISGTLISGMKTDTILEYGRVKLTVRCGNRRCKEINERWVDWGWSW